MEKVRLDVINLYQCDPGFETQERIMNYDYLLYVHSGKGFFRIGNTTYAASIGDIFYCPPHVGNTIIADKEDPFLLSGIECTVPGYRKKLPEKVSLFSHRFLIEVIQEMIEEYKYGKIGSDVIGNALLTVLLENIQRMRGGGDGKKDPAREIMDYIADNINRSITHEELSRVFSYHKNSINRILLKETGLTFKKYMIELRIRKASELLKYSSKTIGEIGEFCGYNSTVFFSGQFKEKTGMTPMQFRMIHKKRGFIS